MIGYNTRQKQLIFKFMNSNKEKQFTCEEITLQLVDHGTPVGKTTVYRQLERLVSEGRVKKLYSHNSKGYVYQFVDERSDCDKHLHLRCSECGEYVHLGCDFMSKVSDHIFRHHDFTVDNSRTEIIGICGKCAAERRGV